MKRLPETYIGLGELENLFNDVEPDEAFIIVAEPLRDKVPEEFEHVYSYAFAEPRVEDIALIKAEMPEDAEVIIAIGGGSVLDTAKILKLEFKGAKQLDEILAGKRKMNFSEITFVAVPTTCGTGSEATSIAIVENLAGDLKKGLIDDEFLPDQVILDAELLANLPDEPFCYSAVDAIVHAVESFLSVNSTSMSRQISMHAITNLLSNFPAARKKDPEALEQMLYSSFMAGYAFNAAGVGAVHALAYPLGAELHIPHGLANGMLLKEVLAFNYEAEDEKVENLDAILELFFEEDCLENLDIFLKLNCIDKRLREFNVTDEDLKRFAKNAFGIDRLLQNNIRQFESEEQILEIYRKIF